MLSNDLLHYATSLGFGELHFKIDHAQELYAIIAIHSTQRGPALGGCRFIEYATIESAIYDALRLAQGMSYKAAIANLPLGGGKTVLIRPKYLKNRKKYFQHLGRFINDLQGRYIVAMDSGIVLSDMDNVALETPYVVTTSKHEGDPGPYTALGVFYGIKAAVKFKFRRDTLKGLHVALQGLGHVGYNLARLLHQEGVHLTICDYNEKLTINCKKEFNAKIVDFTEIHEVNCDIFSPCALGAVLNDETIPKLKASIVAGAANNQLAEIRHATLLKQRNILYAPDYVINAGGLIYAYAEYCNSLNKELIKQRIQAIYNSLLTLFEQSRTENKPPHEIANNMAAARLAEFKAHTTVRA